MIPEIDEEKSILPYYIPRFLKKLYTLCRGGHKPDVKAPSYRSVLEIESIKSTMLAKEEI